jgi:hypothetical protein
MTIPNDRDLKTEIRDGHGARGLKNGDMGTTIGDWAGRE